jgi:hypothetical protein
MSSNNGNGTVSQHLLDEIRSHKLVSKTEMEITLRMSGTSSIKKYNAKIQQNHSMVSVFDSNSTHINLQKIEPNYASHLIETESHVGAGLRTDKAYRAIQSDQVSQQKIQRSMQGTNKITHDSPYGGTGSAVETYSMRCLPKVLDITQRWLMIKPIPEHVEGTPAIKYYLTLSLESFYGNDTPNLIRVFIDERKIERFLSLRLSLLDVCLANAINMKVKK